MPIILNISLLLREIKFDKEIPRKESAVPLLEYLASLMNFDDL